MKLGDMSAIHANIFQISISYTYTSHLLFFTTGRVCSPQARQYINADEELDVSESASDEMEDGGGGGGGGGGWLKNVVGKRNTQVAPEGELKK